MGTQIFAWTVTCLAWAPICCVWTPKAYGWAPIVMRWMSTCCCWGSIRTGRASTRISWAPRFVGGKPRVYCAHPLRLRVDPQKIGNFHALEVHTRPPSSTHSHNSPRESVAWCHVCYVQAHVFCVRAHLCPACCVEARIFARGRVWMPNVCIMCAHAIGQQKSPPQRGEDFRSEVLTLRVSWLFSLTFLVSPFAPLEQPQRLRCLFERSSKPPRQRSSLALARLCRECYVPCSRLHRPTLSSAR